MEDSLRNYEQKKQQYNEVSVSSSKFIGKVFLYTFIALAITAVTAAVIGVIFSSAIRPLDYDYSSFVIDVEKFKPYIILLIVSLVMYFPLLIWITIGAFRGRGRLDIPFVLYAIVMGIIISSMTMFVPIQVTAISLGITTGVFGILALIGLTAKKDLSFLGLVALGIFLGALFIALFNIIWSIAFPSTFQTLYWVISYAILGAMMLVTIVDVNRVRQIAKKGENSNNVAMYCAFNLYVDFVYLFIRILAIVARVSSKR